MIPGTTHTLTVKGSREMPVQEVLKSEDEWKLGGYTWAENVPINTEVGFLAAIRRVIRLRNERNEVKAAAAARLREIDADIAALTTGENGRKLRAYFEGWSEVNGGRRVGHFPLAGAKVALTKVRALLQCRLTDEQQDEAARELGFVIVKGDVAEWKKSINERYAGELLEIDWSKDTPELPTVPVGWVIVPPRESFSINPANKAKENDNE